MNIPGKDRIVSLDIMRGIAIFGIFLVNMLDFHSPMLYLDPVSWWSDTVDVVTYNIIDILAQGSFYPLFSLLFGYGLVILRERTISRGERFLPIALRRLFVLMVIGIVHATLIWHGDILINYALFGLLLLLFMRVSGTGMMITGSLIWLIPNILLGMLFFISIYMTQDIGVSIYEPSEAKQSIEAYQNGSFLEITAQRIQDWYAVNNLANAIFMLFSIFPFFLLGAGAAKLKLVERVKDFKRSFAITFTIFFTIGLLLKLSPYIIDRNLAFEYLQDSIGGPMLAIAYALGVALLVENKLGNTGLAVFAPVGKMSMSNYLFQSVVSTLIFYSYGLGFYNQISAFFGTILVLVIYVIQIVLSSYWLKTHSYGPVEWVWRSVTYKKKQIWKHEGDKG